MQIMKKGGLFMPENTLYALAQTLQQTDSLEHDLSDMLSALKQSVEKEYLQKIRIAADSEKTFTIEHPPKEVTLLRALSAFADDRSQDSIDRMAQGLLFIHSLQRINRNVQDLSAGNLLAARSAEGQTTEEVPSVHSAQLAGLLLTLALADRF